MTCFEKLTASIENELISDGNPLSFAGILQAGPALPSAGGPQAVKKAFQNYVFSVTLHTNHEARILSFSATLLFGNATEAAWKGTFFVQKSTTYPRKGG